MSDTHLFLSSPSVAEPWPFVLLAILVERERDPDAKGFDEIAEEAVVDMTCGRFYKERKGNWPDEQVHQYHNKYTKKHNLRI